MCKEKPKPRPSAEELAAIFAAQEARGLGESFLVNGLGYGEVPHDEE